MATFTDKTPPAFDSKVDNYQKWKKKLKLWESITDVAKAKRGSLITLRLDEDTQEAVLEAVTEENIKAEEGAKNVVDHLDIMFKVDESVTAYEMYEEFENYRRPESLSMKEYCNEFQRRYKKVQATGTTLADHVLAYRVLKSANLSESDTRLVKATVEKMDYASMTAKMKTVFSSESRDVSRNEEIKIKEEPVDYIQDTMYGGAYWRRNADRRNDRGRSGQGDGYRSDSKWAEKHENRSQREDEKQKVWKKKLGKNPLDPQGNITRCLECDSINHWIKYCPDLTDSHKEQRTYHGDHEQQQYEDYIDQKKSEGGFVYVIEHAAVLSDTYEDLTKITLSCDTMSAAVLDSGAPKTVCGKMWLQQYVYTLPAQEKKQIVHSKSKNIFKFGCGGKFPALYHVSIPAVIGQKKVLIQTDVVDGELPLLFSRESMKKTGSNLDFRSDTLEILGQKIKLIVTESGHYAMPLGRSNQKTTDDKLIKLVQSQGKDYKEVVAAKQMKRRTMVFIDSAAEDSLNVQFSRLVQPQVKIQMGLEDVSDEQDLCEEIEVIATSEVAESVDIMEDTIDELVTEEEVICEQDLEEVDTSEVTVPERSEEVIDEQDLEEIHTSEAVEDVEEHVTVIEELTEDRSSDASADVEVSENNNNAQKKKCSHPPKNKRGADTVDQQTGLKSGYKLSEDQSWSITSDATDAAKTREWKFVADNKVYKQVESQGQQFISSKWESWRRRKRKNGRFRCPESFDEVTKKKGSCRYKEKQDGSSRICETIPDLQCGDLLRRRKSRIRCDRKKAIFKVIKERDVREVWKRRRNKAVELKANVIQSDRN